MPIKNHPITDRGSPTSSGDAWLRRPRIVRSRGAFRSGSMAEAGRQAEPPAKLGRPAAGRTRRRGAHDSRQAFSLGPAPPPQRRLPGSAPRQPAAATSARDTARVFDKVAAACRRRRPARRSFGPWRPAMPASLLRPPRKTRPFRLARADLASKTRGSLPGESSTAFLANSTAKAPSRTDALGLVARTQAVCHNIETSSGSIRTAMRRW